MVKTKPKKVHDATLTIRAKRELIDQAREAAHEQGMSLSEAVRQFLRELAEQSLAGTRHPLIELLGITFDGGVVRTEFTEEEEKRMAELQKQWDEMRESVSKRGRQRRINSGKN